MKLDNRPKKLLIKGVNEEGTQALRDWFEVRIHIWFSKHSLMKTL